MRVGVVVNSLQAGGAEKSAIRLARDLSNNHEIEIITLFDDRDFYMVPTGIRRKNLGDIFANHSRNRLKNLRFLKIQGAINWALHLMSIRKFLLDSNFDVVIVFESFVGALISISMVNSKVPIVVSERVNPNPAIYCPNIFTKIVRPFIYRHGVVCTVQTNGFANWCLKEWKIDCEITPNHFEEDLFVEIKNFEQHPKFIAIGRNHPQKGFMDLLQAWRIVESSSRESELMIVTSGDISNLLSLIEKLDLKRCRIVESSTEIVNLIDQSTCLISSSYFEGFPNVVLEAMARGLIIIATKSTDLIDELQNGESLCSVEVGDVLSLSDEILRVAKLEDLSLLSNRNIQTAREFTWKNSELKWNIAMARAIKNQGLRIGFGNG